MAPIGSQIMSTHNLGDEGEVKYKWKNNWKFDRGKSFMEGNEYQARNIDSMLLTIKRFNQ